MTLKPPNHHPDFQFNVVSIPAKPNETLRMNQRRAMRECAIRWRRDARYCQGNALFWLGEAIRLSRETTDPAGQPLNTKLIHN